MNVSVEQAGERRRYFRIEDEIILFFSEISPDEVPDSDRYQESPLDNFALSARLDLLTAESRSQLRKVEREHPVVADFLKCLEQKIDLIAQALLSSDEELKGQPTRRVSLSASGLAFEAERGFDLGAMLELKMVLPPSLVGILTYGRVVYSRYHPAGDNNGFQVAVDFAGLRESDRELLIRHVVKRQLQQLRDQRLGLQ